MIKEELNRAIDMQDEIGSPFIVVHKPKNKNKIKMYDTDSSAFDIVNDEVIFDFWDLEGFKVKLENIKSIVFEKFSEAMTIVHIKLNNSNTVMLHFNN